MDNYILKEKGQFFLLCKSPVFRGAVRFGVKGDIRENGGMDEKQTPSEEQPDELTQKISQWQKANPHATLTEMEEAVEAALAPGVTTAELNAVAEEVILRSGGRPAFKGYRGFPATLCTSVNEVVVQYREEQTESDIFRVREYCDELIADAYFGHLLKIDA